MLNLFDFNLFINYDASRAWGLYFQVAKIIGTDLIWAGISLLVVLGALVLDVARNPSLRGQLFAYAILGFAFAKAIGLILMIFPIVFDFVFIKSAEQIAAELNTIKEKLQKYQEDLEELRKVDEQNTWDGDNDSPNEAASAEESEHWTEQCSNTLKEVTDAIFTYYNNM
jgi:F-type H+-transporting ATPase subunit c